MTNINKLCEYAEHFEVFFCELKKQLKNLSDQVAIEYLSAEKVMTQILKGEICLYFYPTCDSTIFEKVRTEIGAKSFRFESHKLGFLPNAVELVFYF